MSDADHNLLQIAQVLKSNGTDGELVMGLRDIGPDEIDLKEPVFIIFDGLPVPFFIGTMIRRGNRKALVRLTGIRSMEDAEELVGKAVYAESSSLPEADNDNPQVLVGWLLLSIVKNAGNISGYDEKEEITVEETGEITGYLDIPDNPCLEVETKNGTAMIPFHEDLIISIDPESREIIMDIPEGLI